MSGIKLPKAKVKAKTKTKTKISAAAYCPFSLLMKRSKKGMTMFAYFSESTKAAPQVIRENSSRKKPRHIPTITDKATNPIMTKSKICIN